MDSQNNPAGAGPLDGPVRPAADARSLTDQQIADIGFAVLRVHNDDRLWRALTYESGPYDVTKPTLALRDLASAFFVAGIDAASAQSPPRETFCWLVELFEPGGNSLGYYHTGFTDMSGQSRSTRKPHDARRYTTRDEAQAVAAKLHHLAGVWRAVEHGFVA